MPEIEQGLTEAAGVDVKVGCLCLEVIPLLGPPYPPYECR